MVRGGSGLADREPGWVHGHWRGRDGSGKQLQFDWAQGLGGVGC
jgi:hypothetical protein